MDLDLSPLSQATNENWFANETQFEMSVNDLLRENLWNTVDEKWADDVCRRTEASKYQIGNIDGQTWEVTDMWGNSYRAIGRDNAIIDKLNTVGDQVLTPEKKDQFLGECLFVRACMYSKLITLFGDVPYSDTTIDIETALSMGRTPKTEVLQKIYADFDVAIQNLPVSSGTVQRPTKGAAYGDLPFHLNIIQSFSNGCNNARHGLYDIESSFYSGVKLAYPMMTNFLTGALIATGQATLRASLFFPSTLIALSLEIGIFILSEEFTGNCISP